MYGRLPVDLLYSTRYSRVPIDRRPEKVKTRGSGHVPGQSESGCRCLQASLALEKTVQTSTWVIVIITTTTAAINTANTAIINEEPTANYNIDNNPNTLETQLISYPTSKADAALPAVL